MGIAFGAAFLSSAPAIVVYCRADCVQPARAIQALDGLATWLDGTQTLEPLVNEQMSGADCPRALHTAFWVALLLAVGFWRITGSDARVAHPLVELELRTRSTWLSLSSIQARKSSISP